jgi:tetratricopeptide (TPR) repeat protein
MLNIIAFLIIIISLAIILIIIYKKMPLLKQIELEQFDLQKRKKYQLLERRLKRKINRMMEKIKLPSIGSRLSRSRNKLKKFFQTIKEKKNNYLMDSPSEPKEKLEDGGLTKVEELIKKEEFKQAEELIFSIIKDNPKSLVAYKLLAETYLLNKNFVHAEATLEHIIKLAQRLKNLRALDYLQLAKAKLHLEKEGQALQIAKKAISLEPLNPKILHFLVKTCIVCKQKSMAWKYFRKLKEINGDNNRLDELLGELQKL